MGCPNWIVSMDIVFDRILVIQDELKLVVHTIDLEAAEPRPKLSFPLTGSARNHEVCENGIFTKESYPCQMLTWRRFSDELLT